MTDLHLLDWLFPNPCCSCQRLEPLSRLGLCRGCHSRLTPSARKCCPGCGKQLAPSSRPETRCPACAATPTSFSRLVTVWSYEPPIAAVLGALKYSRRSYLSEALADAAWDHHAEVLARCDRVTSIPLAWTRRLKRGFNQSELIARRLASRLGLPFSSTLSRTGWSVQSRSSRSRRRRNVVGAFRLRRQRLSTLHGADILLVDDVVTTGSTLEAASRVLLEGGANTVTALALVRTPSRRGQES